jgi:hypothetical protein
MNQVEKATANPDHDFSKFGTGNKETLDIIPKVPLPFALYFLIFFPLFSGPVLQIRNVYTVSRILIFTHPGSRISGSRFPDPKTATKKRGKKKLVVIPFFHKIEIFFFLTLFALGGFPTPHPISSRPHFCM